jgi:predicted ATPase
VKSTVKISGNFRVFLYFVGDRRLTAIARKFARGKIPMLKSIEIDYFRMFAHLAIRKLRPFNLITGRNASGKTTLLEAVFLNSGGGLPDLVFALNAFRGDPILHAETDRAIATCFYEMDAAHVVKIAADEQRAGRNRSRVLTMNAQVRTELRLGQSRAEKLMSGVKIRFSGPSGTINSSADIDFSTMAVTPGIQKQTQNPVIFNRMQVLDGIFGQFLSPYIREMYQETYQQLSNQTKVRGLDSVLAAIGKIGYSEVRNVVPIVEAGSQPMIYADTGRPRLIPISVMGSGFFHVLRLALALAEIDKGIILIDELEDGLHYSTFERVIETIFDAIRSKPDLQLFVATHSAELLDATISVADKLKFDDICLINLVPSKDGPSAQYYDRGELFYAKSVDADLR